MRRPPLIGPKCTEPYYTKPVEPIEKYTHTQCRWTPLIKPKCTEPCYIKEALPC